MPSYSGQEILDEARRAYLNGGGVSDAAGLVIINASIRRLMEIASEHDAPILNQEADINVTANTPLIPGGGGAGQLPLLCMEVYDVWERHLGETYDKAIPVKEVRQLPNVQVSDRLRWWQWRAEVIATLGASVPVTIRIFYITTVADLASLAGIVAINHSKSYLAADVAARAALSIGHNKTMARDIREEYVEPALSTLLNLYAKKGQSLPVRRQGMRRRGF